MATEIDIFLEGPVKEWTCVCAACGDSHLVCKRQEYYWTNISNRHAALARQHDVYTCIWCPADNGMTHAKHLIIPLSVGLANLRETHQLHLHSSPFSYANAELLIRFIERYLHACIDHPEAAIRIDRWTLRNASQEPLNATH